MDKKIKKKTRKGVKIRLWHRTIIVLSVIMLLFGVIIARLVQIQIVQGEDLQKRAVNQQVRELEISAKRGTIYDTNGKVLAQSATVWNIIIAPIYIKDDIEREYIVEELSEILDLDKDDLMEKTQKKSYYIVIKRGVSKDIKDKVTEFSDNIYNVMSQNENYIDKETGKNNYNNKNIGSLIVIEESYKRYYPYQNFASAVLGFTGSDGQGLAGIEYQYNDVLSGVNGKILTTTDTNGVQTPFSYEQKVDAIDGYSLVLSIDETLQHICEKYLEQGIEDNLVVNRAVAIMMDVNTGEVLAMAVKDDYDPNNPYALSDEKMEEINAITDEKERESAFYAAQSAQWRNKAVSDVYIPGSVYKVITTSACLEENLVTKDSTFTCTGYYVPFAGSGAIGCHNKNGHGTQNLTLALSNSCNPAYMMMGNLLGADKFYQYYRAFGFSEKTGIDLPGEADDIFFQNNGVVGAMSASDLAVGSFGQNFSITPIQMVTAMSAIANGGNLLQPYVVKQILDSDGNVIKTTETVVKRKVVSENTTSQLIEMLQYNATYGTAKNGYVAGYRVAGKTGTSEAKRDINNDGIKDYIASYCGFAPADNPKVALIVYFDTPLAANYYGSGVAAPVFASIMGESLPYLGVEAKYTEEELAKLDTTAGYYTNKTVSKAKSEVENDGFAVIVKGNGTNVIDQMPASEDKIPKGGTIILYTDEESTSDTVVVPDLTNMTLSNANRTASLYNLNISISGTSSSSEGELISYSQSIEEGTSVKEGTVITLYFKENDTVM